MVRLGGHGVPERVGVAVVIVVRTALEDTMLAGGLAGYPEYQKKVRWRLVPFVW